MNSEKIVVFSEIKSFQKKRKTTQASEGTSSRSRTGFKSELKEIMTSLQDVAKSVGNSKQVFSPSQKAIEDAVDALNQLEGVAIDSLFYYSAASVLSDPNKSVAFLKMPPGARLGWLIHLVGSPPL